MISTHVLDLNLGIPAQGVTVILEKKSGNLWSVLQEETTNSDGRILFSVTAEAGIYQLCFQLEEYFKKLNLVPFFIQAPVIFQITDSKKKYHIPLLLNQYGYSTYRGS